MDDLGSLCSEDKKAAAGPSIFCASWRATRRRPSIAACSGEVTTEYLRVSRPPYAVDPLDEKLVRQARAKGVSARLLIESGTLDEHHRRRLVEYASAGVDIRQAPSLPLKLALFDCRNGLIALLDPVISKPTWTSLVFDHPGLGEAMKHLFEDRWERAMEIRRPAQCNPVREQGNDSPGQSHGFSAVRRLVPPLLRQDFAHRVNPAVHVSKYVRITSSPISPRPKTSSGPPAAAARRRSSAARAR